MKILKYGSRGPSVQLLQLALNRWGADVLSLDGIFGSATQAAVRQFQSRSGLAADGVVGPLTNTALTPWYTGYFSHKIHRGDTLYWLAQMYGTTLEAIRIANPDLDAANLKIGSTVTVPLPFDVVPTNIAYSAQLTEYCVRGIAARYPIAKSGSMGRSVMGKPLLFMSGGSGANRVFYNAAHHANEWITTPLLLKFFETLVKTASYGGSIFGQDANALLRRSTIYIAPMVNPDGVDLVTGELREGEYYAGARRIAANYPQFSFPEGWKANVRGVDLNLQYPAGWEQARENKFAQGITSPAPADFVGTAPLTAPESRAVYDFTQSISPALVLAYHTQGQVRYWKYLDYEPINSREIAETFSALSGYAYEDTPYASGFAGFKDWFIQDYNRPGYTVEAGLGINPLPLSDFDRIYADNLGILIYGMLVT